MWFSVHIYLFGYFIWVTMSTSLSISIWEILVKIFALIQLIAKDNQLKIVKFEWSDLILTIFFFYFGQGWPSRGFESINLHWFFFSKSQFDHSTLCLCEALTTFKNMYISKILLYFIFDWVFFRPTCLDPTCFDL